MEGSVSTDLELSREAILGTEDPAEIRYQDPVEVARAIVQRILEAPDADAVLDQAAVEHARDVLGIPFTLRGARFQRSKFGGENGGPTLFALLDVVDGDGAERIVTCGGRNVLAQIYRLLEGGWLPVQVTITEGSETAQGYRPLWLNRV